MATGNNTTSYDALLKEYYSEDEVTNAMFVDNAFLGMVPKKEDLAGRHYVSPIVWGSGAGRSADFTTAQTMASLTGVTPAAFMVSLAENHGDSQISNAIIAETKNDKGAFLEATTTVIDVDLQNFMNDIAIGLYRQTDGSRGQVGSIVTPSGGVANSGIKLLNPKDILNFEVGMQLDVAIAQSSGAVRAYGSNGHGLYVIKVDIPNWTIVVGTTPVPTGTGIAVTDATDGVPGTAANNYLYVKGDRNAKMAGFKDWIPYGGPSATAFFGVDRTANSARLAGTWLDGTAGSAISSVLEDAISNVFELGGKLSHFFMSPMKFALLAKELGSRAMPVDVASTSAQVGYSGIKVVGASGPVICLPDRSCPSDTIAGVNLKTWRLLSIGKVAGIWQEDGRVWLRSQTQAGMEVRYYSLGNLLCTDPRQNINIKVSA